MLSDADFMKIALMEAQKALSLDEVPIGAIIVLENKIIGCGFNQPISQNNPTSHAEIVAIADAAKNIANYRLVNTTLYVTLEPCLMCFGAIINARIKRLVFGASNKREFLSTQKICHEKFNHHIDITSGILAIECQSLLQNFFQKKRQ